MTRLFQKLASKELALGVYIQGAPHLVPTLAKAGFDFVRPDMMFSALDWKELSHILCAAESTGITSVVRIPSNPWLAGEDSLQVTVDAARAFSIGAQVVQVSVASVKQVEALLAVSRGWHRIGAAEYPSSASDLKEQADKKGHQAMFIPSIESRNVIEDMDSILALDGLRAISIACTDFADQLGHPFDYDHPEVWAALDRIVMKADQRGIALIANTGYAYRSREEIIQRVKRLHDHGVCGVMIQNVEFLVEVYSMDLLQGIKEEVM